MIKYQSSALPSFPNYHFHLLHYITFAEQKVMIQLGDCQDIFPSKGSLPPRFTHTVSAPVSDSVLQPVPSHPSSVRPDYSFLSVACGDKIAMPTLWASQPNELSPTGGHTGLQLYYWLLHGCHSSSTGGRQVRKSEICFFFFFFCRFGSISSQIQLFTLLIDCNSDISPFTLILPSEFFFPNTFRRQVLFCTYLHLTLGCQRLQYSIYHLIPGSYPETLKGSTQYFWGRNKFHSILPTLLASSSACLGGGLQCLCNDARVVPSISNSQGNVPPQTKTLFFLTQNQNFSQVSFAIIRF